MPGAPRHRRDPRRERRAVESPPRHRERLAAPPSPAAAASARARAKILRTNLDSVNRNPEMQRNQPQSQSQPPRTLVSKNRIEQERNEIKEVEMGGSRLRRGESTGEATESELPLSCSDPGGGGGGTERLGLWTFRVGDSRRDE